MKFACFFRIFSGGILSLALAPGALGQPHGIVIRPDVAAYYDHVFPPDAPAITSDWSTVVAFPGLSFLNPVGMIPVPGTNKLLVWEREGKIWIFENDPAVSTKTLALDLSANCQGWDDSGLLAVAFHPDFANNRQLFAWYNWRGGVTGGSGDMGPVIGNANTRPPTNTPTRDRLSRFTLNAGFQASQANEYIVIDQKDASVWHNGGGMFFHPDNGFLYLTNGDDSNANLNTQRIDRALFSAVLRIDVDKRGGDVSHAPPLRALNEVSPDWPRYYVPNDNPFVGQPNALEEIFAIGLRSPHRMSIDAVTGRIFIGDVGAEVREEISVIEPNDPPGLNFQWSRLEGNVGDLVAPFVGSNKRPIIDYPHGTDDGSCVIGGHVYRGSAYPELIGKYIFGDNMSGRIWYLDETTTPVSKVLLATLPDGPGPNSGNDYRGLGSFGQDAAGELYMCRLSSTDGRIYKLQRGGADPGTPLPPTLAATGLFTDLIHLTPSEKLIPYELNEPFWSDKAIKTRFAAIPNGTKVGFTPSGEWNFPAGSVFVKHFDLPVSDVDPTVVRRLETRFIVKKEDGSIYGATYKWRADQTNADLLDGSLTENISIATEPLGSLTGTDIGNPALGGSTTRQGNLVTITAGGTDIWGTADQFHFAHQLRSGDFDVSVRVESVSQADLYTKTGLMVRDSLDANAKHIMALVFPSNAARNNNDGGYEFQYRATTGGNATALYPPDPQPRVNYPDTWLRMKREGNTFIAFSGSDGFTWREYARTTLALPQSVHFGLAVTAHTASPRTTAKFQIETRRQPWFYPGRQNCVTCHNSQAGGVLGLSTRQLNKDHHYTLSDITDNQLRAWNHAGLFEAGPEDSAIPALEKLAHHDDLTASLEKRARSYLDANCSSCHRPGGVQAYWDARYDTPLGSQGIYYGEVSNSLGNPDARVVVPRSLLDSIMHRRVSIVGENQMPPLARNLVDHAGVKVLEDWIQSLVPEEVAAPDALAAIAISHTRVDLVWQEHSSNEKGFLIERSIDNNFFVEVGVVPPDTTSFSDLTAEPFTGNFYRVRAFGEYVSSAFSNTASATTDIGPPSPEIRVTGNGRLVSNGDVTPDISNGTDFGVALVTGGSVTKDFVLENIGNAPLELSGSPRIQITGADATSFSILSQPPQSLPGPGGVAFQLRFTPQSLGVKIATVRILSNDPDEAVSIFTVTGNGVSQDLIAWWRFNETTGTVAYDSAMDRDGNLTAPLPSWEADGRFGGALHFNGQQNQSVTVPNHSSLNPTSALSIASWVYAVDWNGNRRVMQKGNGDDQFRLLAENGKLVWDIKNVGRLEAALPVVGSWFHLAATYDGTKMRLFVNGAQVVEKDEAGAIPVTNNALYIGTKTPGSIAADHFNGALDDLRLYGRALGDAEISALAAQTGIVTIAATDASARKGVNDPGRFLVTRTGSTTDPMPVGISVLTGNGQASEALDFTLSPSLTTFSIPAGMASADIGVNPLDRGEVTGPLSVTVKVGEGSGYVPGENVVAQVSLLDSPLNQWKITSFGSLAAAQASSAHNDADADHDGLTTLLEAALGGSPFMNDSKLLPSAKLESVDGVTYLVSTYRRPRPTLAGLVFIDGTSSGMTVGGWEPAVMVPGYPINNQDGTETVKVRSVRPVSDEPRQFIRLQISKP